MEMNGPNGKASLSFSFLKQGRIFPATLRNERRHKREYRVGPSMHQPTAAASLASPHPIAFPFESKITVEKNIPPARPPRDGQSTDYR
jgi:hypothetical protein